jgi:hypothetical protein
MSFWQLSIRPNDMNIAYVLLSSFPFSLAAPRKQILIF